MNIFARHVETNSTLCERWTLLIHQLVAANVPASKPNGNYPLSFHTARGFQQLTVLPVVEAAGVDPAVIANING